MGRRRDEAKAAEWGRILEAWHENDLSVREFCELAFGEVGLDYRDFVKVDPAFFRAADVTATVGDPSRARRELGWRPTVDIEALVAMMVAADERRLVNDRVTTLG